MNEELKKTVGLKPEVTQSLETTSLKAGVSKIRIEVNSDWTNNSGIYAGARLSRIHDFSPKRKLKIEK